MSHQHQEAFHFLLECLQLSSCLVIPSSRKPSLVLPSWMLGSLHSLAPNLSKV
jgi:hypothetical protein